jgi:S-adenosylmethionine/arginine decarboxylase-like enzyme
MFETNKSLGAPSDFPITTASPPVAWGLSTAVDLKDCDSDTIRDAAAIQQFVVALCDLIQMKRYGECQVVHFGQGRVAGYSMVQLIETSLISGHFANETHAAYLDVFSCKPYDPAIVEEFARKFFGARSSTRRTIHRE